MDNSPIRKKNNKLSSQWAVFDYFPDAVYVTSYDDYFLYANDEACKIWNKKREEIVGFPIFIVFPQTKGSILEEKRKECLSSRKPLIAEFYFPSSPYEGWYEIIHTPTPDGIITRFKIIQEKKKASQSIDFLYELLSMVLQQIREPMIIVDLRYQIKEGNEGLLSWQNARSKSDLIGKSFLVYSRRKKQILLEQLLKTFLNLKHQKQ